MNGIGNIIRPIHNLRLHRGFARFHSTSIPSKDFKIILIHSKLSSIYRAAPWIFCGRIQLKKMLEWTAKRNDNAQQILEVARQFEGLSGILRAPQFHCQSCDSPNAYSCAKSCMHAQYKCYVYVRSENLVNGWSRDRIVAEINQRGVPCYQGSCSEVYLEKAFDGTGFRPSDRLPNAKLLGETSLMFLVHPTITQDEIELTKKTLLEVFSLASG